MAGASHSSASKANHADDANSIFPLYQEPAFLPIKNSQASPSDQKPLKKDSVLVNRGAASAAAVKDNRCTALLHLLPGK